MLVLGFLAVNEYQKSQNSGLDPKPDPGTIGEQVAVWYARHGGVELLLAPFYGNAERRDFNAKIWNEQLERGDQPLSYFSLWLSNQSEKPEALPANWVEGLEVDGKIGAHSIVKLMAELEDLSPYFRNVMANLSGKDVRELAGREFLRVALALPGGTRLDQLKSVTIDAFGAAEFRAAKLNFSEFLLFQEHPQSRHVDFLTFLKPEKSAAEAAQINPQESNHGEK